jgi:hypothetical protein
MKWAPAISDWDAVARAPTTTGNSRDIDCLRGGSSIASTELRRTNAFMTARTLLMCMANDLMLEESQNNSSTHSALLNASRGGGLRPTGQSQSRNTLSHSSDYVTIALLCCGTLHCALDASCSCLHHLSLWAWVYRAAAKPQKLPQATVDVPQ